MAGATGHEAAFEAFLTAATPALQRTAYLMTGDAHAAAELLQASLVKTWLAWPRVREGEALAYTRRVMANHNVSTWRRSRREDVTADLPELATQSAVGGIESHDELRRLLAALTPQQRAVVVLRYYADLSEREVAEQLGVSVGTVKSAASRGLAVLRDITRSVDLEGGSR